MPNWTEKQKEAIYTRNSNIIVSAGAGSGKTEVLSERVLTRVMEKIPITEMLVLTFTNNAAFEMKERIKKKLKANNLIEDANLTDSADITTFDAFTLSLVKKYHYLLKLDNNINIIDSSIIKKKKKQYIDEIFNEYYEKNDIDFISLITNFCSKNDKQIKKTILDLDYKFDLITNKKDFLVNYINDYYSKENIDKLFNEYTNLLIKRIDVIRDLLDNLKKEVNEDFFDKYSKELNPLLSSKTYDDIKNNCIIERTILRNASNEAKYYKNQISDILKILKKYTSYTKESIINDLYETKKYSNTIINIIIKLTDKINEFKLKNQMFEFNDISTFAIKLVKENEDVRNYLKYHYKEIMIDEYQDTSDIEEEFINLIENNNVYMVGDIKQSIYRFRNANPLNFQNKYDNYKKNINGIKIDLNKNFRSRKEVLDDINVIFNHIMDNKIGNAKYQEEHQLIFGNDTFNTHGKTNNNNNLEILNYQKDNKFTNEEIEAFIIANDIKNKINSKYLVLDKETLRPCKYNDFSILMDRSIAFNTYKKVFDYLKIPVYIYQDNDILFTDENYLINNIIGLAINIKNNINDETTRFYYTSIARSYLYNEDDNIIYNNIKNGIIKTTTIYKKATNISEILDNSSNLQILNKIIKEFNFYEKMITVGNIEDRTIILNNLANKFTELNKVGMSIYEVNDYLSSLINDKEKIKISNIKEDIDAVIITNIHKSKGLEYKICYYSELFKEFNTEDIKPKIRYDNKYGLIIPNYNKGFIETFTSFLSKERFIEEDVSERIRLLYVALTRCKEKMIIISNLEEKENYTFDSNNIVDYLTRISYTSFKDILNSIYPYIKKYIVETSIPEINDNYKYQNNISLDNIKKDNNKLEVITPNYNQTTINEEHFSKNNNKLFTKEEKENMEYGTKIHNILELIDFNNPNLSLLNDNEKDIIKGLLSNDIMKNIDNAKIYKEYEFIYKDTTSIKTGIIDLMLEYNDHIDIIDYKLKNTNDKEYLKQITGYKNYITNKTNKPVNIYLYSLLNKELIDLN